MNADGGDGGACLGAFCDGVADDFLVFINDALFDTLESCKSSVRVQRIPEDSFENIASFKDTEWSRSVVGVCFGVREVPFDAPVCSLGMLRLVDRECNCKKYRIKNIRYSQ